MGEHTYTSDQQSLVDQEFDLNWFKDILFKIKQKIEGFPKPHALRELLEVCGDGRNEGKLDACLMCACRTTMK